jgi:hypothetical protein
MKIGGFTFLRNARTLGYPFLESIASVLPPVIFWRALKNTPLCHSRVGENPENLEKNGFLLSQE